MTEEGLMRCVCLWLTSQGTSKCVNIPLDEVRKLVDAILILEEEVVG